MHLDISKNGLTDVAMEPFSKPFLDNLNPTKIEKLCMNSNRLSSAGLMEFLRAIKHN